VFLALVFLAGESAEGDFILVAPLVFLAGELTAVIAAMEPLRDGDCLATEARVFLPGESFTAAVGGVVEGDFLLAFLCVCFAGESDGSGGGVDPTSVFSDGLVPISALDGGLD
jgi:hypothetical protein